MSKHVFFIVLLTLSRHVFAQCNCQTCDSISLREVKRNWSTVKHLFVPNDLATYTLLIEDLDSAQLATRAKAEMARYGAKQSGVAVIDTCDAFTHNMYPRGLNHLKWLDKCYGSAKKYVNVDSLGTYSTQAFPYVLMPYYELVWLGEKGETSSRGGFYIWDRRKRRRYNVLCALGRSDTVWLFKNLNK